MSADPNATNERTDLRAQSGVDNDDSDLRLLIVDDDSDQRLAVTKLLEAAGITAVASAADAEEGIAVAASHRPDVILLDLAMPGRSGYDALPDLQRAAPGATIVVLSNLPVRRLADKLRARGAVAFVEKRTAPQILVAEVLAAAALNASARRTIATDLAADGSSARVARRIIREALSATDRSLVDDVELLVSELITNAVVHTATEPRLEVELTPARVRVSVHDRDPTLPERRDPTMAVPGGRGLNLLNQIASRWGAEPHVGGKIVWFEIDRRH